MFPSFMDFVALAGSLALLTALYVYNRPSRSSLNCIPGPECHSFIFGNLRELLRGQVGETDFKWQAQFGHVVKFKGCFGEDCLLLSDPRALQYLYSEAYLFQKHPVWREMVRMFFGRGLVWAEGDDHKRQRRIYSPAFSASKARAYLPVFTGCAAEVIAKWSNTIVASQDASAVIDVTKLISLAALDAIGRTAFAYEFHAVAGGDNELRKSFHNIPHLTFGNPSDLAILGQGIAARIPITLMWFLYDNLPLEALKRVHRFTALATRVSRELVADKAEELLAGKDKRDIMSLLVKANASSNAQTRLTEEEMIAQLHTTILAGHETVSTAMNWTLLELARNLPAQKKLRAEIFAMEDTIRARGESEFTATDLEQNMPYLNALLKESLRFHPPVTMAIIYSFLKVPISDATVPLSKPIVAPSGEVFSAIAIPKGTAIHVSIAGFNRNKEIFGADAHNWRPERWLDGSVRTETFPMGPYAGMTFSSGPRNCIGWRLAVLEMSALIIELTKNFVFELTPSTEKVRREACNLMVAVIDGEEEKGMQLPLKISIISRQ